MNIALKNPIAPAMDYPVFDHAPMPGRWSMIAYEGGEPLEYNFAAGSLKRAIRRANDLTIVSVRRRFVLRDPDGVVVRNQAWDAKLGVMVYPGLRTVPHAAAHSRSTYGMGAAL